MLVVDVEQVPAGAMSDYLGRYGYSVTVKNSGEEALRAIDNEPCEIVLLDYRLPRMDGLEYLCGVRAAARDRMDFAARTAAWPSCHRNHDMGLIGLTLP